MSVLVRKKGQQKFWRGWSKTWGTCAP